MLAMGKREPGASELPGSAHARLLPHKRTTSTLPAHGLLKRAPQAEPASLGAWIVTTVRWSLSPRSSVRSTSVLTEENSDAVLLAWRASPRDS